MQCFYMNMKIEVIYCYVYICWRLIQLMQEGTPVVIVMDSGCADVAFAMKNKNIQSFLFCGSGVWWKLEVIADHVKFVIVQIQIKIGFITCTTILLSIVNLIDIWILTKKVKLTDICLEHQSMVKYSTSFHDWQQIKNSSKGIKFNLQVIKGYTLKL